MKISSPVQSSPVQSSRSWWNKAFLSNDKESAELRNSDLSEFLE